ncbi:hypothetical protein [Leptospira sp. GIMC2001]|uniref:hypothetical protein n=1 Tax=Leptospira sp. GIMC2001 TaxID=1513297 RepID=UPI00234AC762|nr:hypothetical protein [Leptospira sp. GIMC2001]WCL49033.1 hypothetical protein O4O04_17340 [Leptospira sp. GIMC2001]
MKNYSFKNLQDCVDSFLVISLSVFIFVFPKSIYSDRIAFKSGATIEGEIIEKNDNYLIINVKSELDNYNIDNNDYSIDDVNSDGEGNNFGKYLRIESEKISSVQLAFRGYSLCYKSWSSIETKCGYILIRWSKDRIVIASQLDPYKSISLSLEALHFIEIEVDKKHPMKNCISEGIKLEVLMRSGQKIQGELIQIYEDKILIEITENLEREIGISEMKSLIYTNKSNTGISMSNHAVDSHDSSTDIYDYLLPGLNQFKNRDSWDRYTYLGILSLTIAGIVLEYSSSRIELKKQQSNIIPVRVGDNFILLDYSDYSKFEEHKRKSNLLFLGLATIYVFNFHYVYNYKYDANLQFGFGFHLNPSSSGFLRTLNDFNTYELFLTIRF